MLNQISTVLPASGSGAAGKGERVSKDDPASAGFKGLREIVDSAPRYRSPEELGVDLLVLCGTALLQEDAGDAHIAAAAGFVLCFESLARISWNDC